MKKVFLFTALVSVGIFGGCRKHDHNKVPVADAGPMKTVQLPADTVTLTGTGTDEDGFIVGYLWSKVSGPNIPAIHNPGSATTKISGLITGTYRFQLMVIDDDGATGMDTVSVQVFPPNTQTLTLQPGGAEVEDARVVAVQSCVSGAPIENSANFNFPDLLDLPMAAWTFNSNGCETGQYRSFLKFTGMNSIPSSATILSARLSLFGVTTSLSSPQGNSYYTGSPYASSGTNECWIKRATANWSENTITWNNMPAITETGRAAIPASTSQWNYNVADIDVTAMVQAMVNGNANYGFCIMLQNESFYRSMNFGSSDNPDPARRPKLVITYQ
jgi:hypothetical protein